LTFSTPRSLKQAVDDVDMDNEELHSRFRTVVGAVLLVFNPLSVETLSDLLGVPGVSTTLRPLHSLLLVPTTRQLPFVSSTSHFQTSSWTQSDAQTTISS
jgi:hypothetical protein